MILSPNVSCDGKFHIAITLQIEGAHMTLQHSMSCLMQSKVATSQGRHNSEIQTWDTIRVVSPMAILKNNSPEN
jgi:hypothetical protein